MGCSHGVVPRACIEETQNLAGTLVDFPMSERIGTYAFGHRLVAVAIGALERHA
jgi:hypothetical protein